jgi:hypothetical protein
MIQRLEVVVVDGERQWRARRQQGVGGVVGAPAVVGVVRRDVVDDGEAPGSSGASWGGLLLRRASATVSGGELAIGARQWLIDGIEAARRTVVRWGRDWRAQFGARSAPFIAARGGSGAELGSPWSPSVQGCEEPRRGRVR